ncbi:MAG: hypothetical protein ABSD57_00275 [Verrucomicrobiota bacterium]|jgi:hypothetical protein
MTTEKQIQTNRKNASKSTGPRSVAGKMISSRNSTRHGFYAINVLLPDEDREEFIRMGRRLVLFYAPSSVLEEEQVRTIIETRWQLRRANLVDTELFQMYRFYEQEQRGVGTAFAQDAIQGNAFSKLTRYQSFLLRKLQAAEKELDRLRAVRAATQPAPGLGAADTLNSPKAAVFTATPDSARREAAAQQALKWLKQEDLSITNSANK